MHAIMAVALSPDGHLLVSGGNDGALNIWDFDSYRFIKTLPGHTNWVRSVVFNHDSTKIYSGSDDETIKIWDIHKSECIATLHLPRPYEGMNITNATGFSDAQCKTLYMLGAIDNR
jgi:WD40 repeat protein